MKKRRILWISRYAAYDGVRHAGGQNFNYYLKRMANEDYEICMLAFCEKDELSKIDCEKYGISSKVYCAENDCGKTKRRIINLEMRYSPFNKHGNFCDNYIAKKVISYVRSLVRNELPDIIILHWTEIVLLASEIKSVLPKVKLVAIEEDVAFLGLQRAAETAKNMVIRCLKEIKYKRLRKEEIYQLKMVDMIYTTNYKDKMLLEKQGLSDVMILSSYFNKLDNLIRTEENNHSILFYGAMNREENYNATIWFINNVFYFLGDNWKFYVVGNKPHHSLLEYQSDRIIITGFVDSVSPYFEKSTCFVAPLITGAGIKIKVLEAMSSGIPVLTNSIGIEGIPAEPGREYYHCKSEKDYLRRLHEIEKEFSNARAVGIRGKELVVNKFDYEKSFISFKKTIYDLLINHGDEE